MDTTTELIELAGLSSTALTATDAAKLRRDELLTLARKGTIVKTADSAQRAGTVLKEITAFTRQIEASRKRAKDPVIALGKAIEALADELCAPLTAEANRIGGLIASFQEEQRRLEQEARRRAFEEQERIRKEAEEKERFARQAAELEARKAREAQEAADREAAELEAKADRARSAERQAQLQKEAAERRAAAEEQARKDEAARKEAQDKAARERAEAQKAMAAQNTAVSMAVAPKLEGLTLRSEIKFEVTDIQALFSALPGMVLLTPNNAAIKAQLKTLPEGQSLPGVRHWKEAKTSVR